MFGFFVLLLVACRGERAVASTRHSACFADATGALESLRIATIPFPDDFEPSSGIAVSQSVVASLDLRSGFISLFDTTTRAVVGRLGRTGNGPQEFLGYAQSEGLRTPPAFWIDARNDTIAAFDGRQIHLWASGRPIGDWAIPLSVRSGIRQTSAIRWSSSGIIVGVNRPPAVMKTPTHPGGLSCCHSVIDRSTKTRPNVSLHFRGRELPAGSLCASRLRRRWFGISPAIAPSYVTGIPTDSS